MSDEIKKKLLQAQHSQQLLTLLSSVPHLKFLQYAEEQDLISPNSVWERISQINMQPTSKISVDILESDLSAWLFECLKKLNTGNTCYLSVGGLGDLPWAKVHVVNSSEWLVSLWNTLKSHDLVILSEDLSTLVGFTEEEYFYEVFIQDLPLEGKK
jgi:hypothetical protein